MPSIDRILHRISYQKSNINSIVKSLNLYYKNNKISLNFLLTFSFPWCNIINASGMMHNSFARVAQWWSIALPRRGSRVRIPSRALFYCSAKSRRHSNRLCLRLFTFLLSSFHCQNLLFGD